MRTLIHSMVTALVCVVFCVGAAQAQILQNGGLSVPQGTEPMISTTEVADVASPSANWNIHAGGNMTTVTRETRPDDPSNTVLHISAMQQGSGINQGITLNPSKRYKTSCTIQVISGSVRISVLNSSGMEVKGTTATNSTYATVAMDGITPTGSVNTFAIYSTGGAAEYYVDTSSVEISNSDPNKGNKGSGGQ